MKYLRRFNEGIEDEMLIINDILLELSDENFNVRVKEDEHHVYSKSINVVISKDGGNFDFWTERNISRLTTFKFIDVKEYLLRALTYAKSQGWNDYNFEVITPSNTLNGKLFNDGTYQVSLEKEGDEFIYSYYTTTGSSSKYNPPKRVYKSIADDTDILCVYIGLGK